MKRKNAIMLIMTALIWGIAFVAQSEGGDAIGPFTFNGVRAVMGGLVLIPVFKLFDKLGFGRAPKSAEDKRNLLIGGIACGVVMSVASNFQQMGLAFGAEAGKAGFLTACYILIVPILGIFLKRTCSWNVWVGAGLTVIGLYLLCINGSFSLAVSDLLLLICAFFYAIHILVIDHFSPLVDGVRLSCIQFLVAGGINVVLMVPLEVKPLSGGLAPWLAGFANPAAWITLLYAGIASCGIAYTLQILGQQGMNPSIASLLMSLESVFSVLAGWVLLHEVLSMRALGGCVLIFVAVVLAQIPVGNRKKAIE